MNLPNPELEKTAGYSTRLGAALDDGPSPLFAVFDGGLFDDLEDELEQAGISGRSLFLREGNEDTWRNGPWLVKIDNRRKREFAERRAAEKPCVVFWYCIESEQALWRHLRSINEILIPDTRFAAQGSRAPLKYERVLFRHWDPAVLASILPHLDVDQFGRFFGPAAAITLGLVDSGNVVNALRPTNLASVPAGPLTLRPDQLAAIEDQSKLKYCMKMSAILREMAPDETAAMSDRELHGRILRYEASGNRMGLTQERSLSIWNFLMLLSGDRFESKPEIRGFLQSKPGTPDENVETLLSQMLRLTGTMREVH